MIRKELIKLHKYIEQLLDGTISQDKIEADANIKYDDNTNSLVIKIDNIEQRDYDWLRQ